MVMDAKKLNLTKENIVNPLKAKNTPIRILVLDDDPIFGQVIQRYTKGKNVEVDVCQTASEFADRVANESYHVTILDYYLEHYRGTHIANALRDLPVVLISRKSQWLSDEPIMPRTVQTFVHKKYGANAILEAALKIGRNFLARGGPS